MRRIFPVLIFILISYQAAFPQVSSEKYLNGVSITGITKYGDYLWISTYGQGIYRYSIKEDKWWNYSTRRNNLNNDFFYCIAVSRYYVWAGAVNGLYTLNLRKDEWKNRKFALGGEMGNWIRSLCYDPQQNVLWIGRFQNLTKLEVGRQRYSDRMLMQNNDAKTNTIKAIKLDGDKYVWFGTENGVFRYNKRMSMDNRDAWQFINNKDGGFLGEGESVSISDMLFDPESVWFGTDEFITLKDPKFNLGGIFRYNRKRTWNEVTVRNGLPGNGVYCLARTGNKIWAGVYSFDKSSKKDYGRGLALIDRETMKVTNVDLNELQLNSSKITCLYFDGTNMWLGTDDGLCKIIIENPLARWTLKKPEQAEKEKPVQRNKRR